MSAGPPAAGASCPSCGHPVGPDDNFCEACRAELSPAAASAGAPGRTGTCPDHPAAAVTAEGYCEDCGRRVPVDRDHAELNLGLLAGVTDRGLRHHQNEDAMALATARDGVGPVALAVVCDGVSSSSQAADASLAAAQAAIDVLLTAVRAGTDLDEACADAVAAARSAVSSLAGKPGPGDSPSATFVSAVLTGRAATLCWLGDSRAYWMGTGPKAMALRLTRDDSLAEEMTAAGILTEEEAMKSPQAHVITGWVGSDLHAAAPHVATFEPPGPGVLMLCSDGLWNYQPEAAELAALAMPRALADPLGAAGDLVQFALSAGGRDNVTVVLVPFPPAPPEAAATRRPEAAQARYPTPTLPITIPAMTSPPGPARPGGRPAAGPG